MRAAFALWGNDWKNIVRDRTVSFLLFVPLVFVAFLRYIVPLAESRLPLLAGHRPAALALFCLIACIFPAFVLSLILLDEKDEDLFSVYRVLPIAPRRFLAYRLAFAAALGFTYPLILIAASRLVAYSWPRILVLAALCALLAPVWTLVVVSIADNKIEGMTVIKGLFPLIVLPLVGLIVEARWAWAFAVLPAYWIYQAFAAADAAALTRAAVVAVAVHAAVLTVFYRRFRRRVFP